MNNQDQKTKQKLGMFSILKSILAAGFGVQKKVNQEKDFAHGKAIHFIIGGVITTILFLLAIWGLVKFALYSAG